MTRLLDPRGLGADENCVTPIAVNMPAVSARGARGASKEKRMNVCADRSETTGKEGIRIRIALGKGVFGDAKITRSRPLMMEIALSQKPAGAKKLCRD